ncbi:hypothetical protein BGZ46_009296 [Entomortierella lignicola]|nr:hypothetical protein BGZ46_009296 [Entomortierella lignicola]
MARFITKRRRSNDWNDTPSSTSPPSEQGSTRDLSSVTMGADGPDSASLHIPARSHIAKKFKSVKLSLQNNIDPLQTNCSSPYALPSNEVSRHIDQGDTTAKRYRHARRETGNGLNQDDNKGDNENHNNEEEESNDEAEDEYEGSSDEYSEDEVHSEDGHESLSDSVESGADDSEDEEYTENLAENTDPDWNGPGRSPLEYPDVIPNDQYYPEHPYVRSRIDGLYFELATSRVEYFSLSPSSSARPTNIQELVDQLIRAHLPQFWSHRERDPVLNRFSETAAQNPRPHLNAMLVTCVDCGFKFHKQPLYDCPATERHDLRKTKQLIPESKDDSRKRSPWKERKAIKAVELFAKLKGRAIHSDTFSRTDIDNILNNNRRSKNYDGNLDYIGLKEEGHPADCPRNRSSKGHGTKLHFGWEMVLGHNHSAIPVFPQAISNASSMGRGAYYPARSLMASFAHLLPRGQSLPQDQLRKLFAYFIWHRWFDCDLQAMTIRKGYSELWPLFMLRDEGPELTFEEITRFRWWDSIRTSNAKRVAKMHDIVAGDGTEHHNKKQKQSGDVTSLKAGKQTRPSQAENSAAGNNREPLENTAGPYERASVEQARIISMEQRYTTLLNIGLMNHGVENESRHLSVQEQVRRAKEIARGWVLGHSEHLTSKNDGGGSNAPKAKAVHKIFEYTARVKDTYSFSYHPITRNFTNPAFTKPEKPDALATLTRRLDQLSQRAELRRRQLGFVIPEYMAPHKTMKNKPTETRTTRRRSRTKPSINNGGESSRSTKLSTTKMMNMNQLTPHEATEASMLTAPRPGLQTLLNGSSYIIASPTSSPQEHFSYLGVPSQARRDSELLMESLSVVNYPAFQKPAFSDDRSSLLSSTASQGNIYNQPNAFDQANHPLSSVYYGNPGTRIHQELDFNAFLNFDSSYSSDFTTAPPIMSQPSVFNETATPYMLPPRPSDVILLNMDSAYTTSTAASKGDGNSYCDDTDDSDDI